MFYLLHAAMKGADKLDYYNASAGCLLIWTIALKYFKIFAHFQKHPRDIVYFPAYLVFGYWCTFVKIWAMLTCWNVSWATAKVSNEVDDAREAEQNTCEKEDGSLSLRNEAPTENRKGHTGVLAQLGRAIEKLVCKIWGV